MEDSINGNVEFFRKAFDLSPDAININRMSDGLYVSVNEGFTKISGYQKEELMGKTSIELNLWADPSDRAKLLEELANSGKVSNLEVTFRMKDGMIRYGMMSAVSFNLEGVPHILSLTRDVTDRKCFENALRESEARYRQLMDLAPDGILLGDHSGKMIGANSNMLKISGRTLQELIGSGIEVLFSEEELKAVPLRYDLVQKGEVVTIERTIIRPDGTGIPVEMHSKMMPDGSYQMFCHDISDRRNSEYELRKLSRAVEQSPVSIVITDSSGTIEYVNSKICESTGYSKEELIGQNPRIWSSHEKTREEYREFWKTIKSGNEWKGEFHNRHKNGSLFWERATVSPLKNEKDEITHFLGTKEDITIQKILEEKTRMSEKQYREIFVANPIPAFIFYEDTLEFIDINEAAIMKYGFSREEFSSMTLRDIRPPGEWENFLKMKKEFGNAFHSAITRHMRKDRTIFPVDVTSHALPEKNGRKARLSMVIDITERVKAAEQMKLAKEKAEASDKLKTVFLNNISHEVRTPLNGIMGFVDIITQPDLSETIKKESVLMLIESSNRLLDTITSYMDISLLTSGSMTVISKDFIPADVLKELYNNYVRICSEKNIKLYLEIPEEYRDGIVNSDSEIFNKAFSHILDNAVKFTDEGSIRFGLRNAGENIEFFVSDTGLGIDRENIENIFNPFYKGVHTKTSQTQGSGLGLPIAKGLIELLGGKTSVTSEKGKGSEFTFSIPAWNKLLIKNMEQKEEEVSKQSGKPLILVAEDDETNFFYLNALLKFETDADVIHASNGREAIEMFNSNPGISIILMDIKMPEIDGLEATRQIKKIKKEIPIIGITAYSMTGDKERVLSAGCDGYISKPINKRNLLNKMEEFIDLGKQ